MFPRLINLSKSRSFFLFGARGTGKSHLLNQFFRSEEAHFLDLLNPELADKLSIYPQKLLEEIEPYFNKKEWIVIDEVQKSPKLLDLVHQQISKKRFKFALTGSSARKLRRGNANLLAGRATVFSLFPLTFSEYGNDFSINEILSYGSLPEVLSTKDTIEKKRILKSYTKTFLQEEIIAEQVIRNLPPFRKFLEVSANNNCEILNYSNIAKDILSESKTVFNYFQILEDTLLGFVLPAHHTSIRKQQKKSPKFYFFDTGVVRALSGKIDFDVPSKSFDYGLLFESFVINQIRSLLIYKEEDFKLSYLRTKEDVEIDLIVEKANEVQCLCEIKSAEIIDERHTAKLDVFLKDFPKAKAFILSNSPRTLKIGNVWVMPWKEGIKEIVS